MEFPRALVAVSHVIKDKSSGVENANEADDLAHALSSLASMTSHRHINRHLTVPRSAWDIRKEEDDVIRLITIQRDNDLSTGSG